MATPLSRDDLFDVEFLESLTRLRMIALRVARGGRHAEQRSRDLGSGIEFRDYRAYTPGDDFRAIDWNIYQRLGRVFLRLFEELEDLPVYLLSDLSDSLFLEQPPRARAALRTALAFSAIALGQHDSVGFFPFGADLRVALKPKSGKGRLLRFADVMAQTQPQGRTDLARSLQRFASLRLRPGLAVVISDFFDPAGIEAVTEALKSVRHRLLLVALTRPSDGNPEVEEGLRGDLQLVDCETGSVADVSVTPAVIASYRAAYDRFQAHLTDFARARDIGLLRLDCDREIVPQLASLFETGALLV